MREGSIIATIITVHIARNDAAAPDHVWPGIRIHAIDIVQPPGISINPVAVIELHHSMVSPALAATSSVEMPMKQAWDPLRSALGVIVMMAPPDALLVPPLRCTVEPL